MTNENKIAEDKKLSSQKQYLELLPQVRDLIVKEQELWNLTKRVGRNAGYARHEVDYDMRNFVDEAYKLIDQMNLRQSAKD